MFSSHALVSLILITLTAVDAGFVRRGTGKATLSFATKINQRGTLSILERDRARAHALTQRSRLGKQSTHSVSVEDSGLSFTAEVGVGFPPTNYTLLIDTGSSNIWVGAGKSYVRTNTSHDTGHTFYVPYGSANATGEEWTDTVTLSPDLVIHQQSIGVANSTQGLSSTGYDGILGVGPVDLTGNSVKGVSTIPTVMDNLLSQGTISREMLGVYFVPSSVPSSTGELTFGDYDESATTTPVFYVPVTTTKPASYYWGIEQSISYGEKIIMQPTSGVVDTGTTRTYITTEAYNEYVSATGAVYDNTTTLLKITSSQYDKLQPLVFHIGAEQLALSPNAQIWPRSLNTFIGGSPDAIYLTVGDIGSLSVGAELGSINGYTFLQRYYSVYDTANKRVGFAETAYTHSESN